MRFKLFLTLILIFVAGVPCFAQEHPGCIGELAAKAKRDFSANYVDAMNSTVLVVSSKNDPDKGKLAGLESYLKPETKCPGQEYCLAVYSRDLLKRIVVCGSPKARRDSGQDLLKSLYKYVRKLPATKYDANVNGYAALLKLAPGNSYYQKKYDFYLERRNKLDTLLGLMDYKEQQIFAKHRLEGEFIYLEINPLFWQAMDSEEQKGFTRTLADFWTVQELPYLKGFLYLSDKNIGYVQCLHGNPCEFVEPSE